MKNYEKGLLSVGITGAGSLSCGALLLRSIKKRNIADAVIFGAFTLISGAGCALSIFETDKEIKRNKH